MFVVKSASCTLDSRRLSKRQEALIKNKQKNFNASQAFSLLFVQTTKASWKMRTIIMRPLANRKTITHYHTHTHRNRNVCGSLIGRGGGLSIWSFWTFWRLVVPILTGTRPCLALGSAPPNISPNPEKVGVLVASEGSCAGRHCRGCKNTRPSSASSGMVITTLRGCPTVW